MKNPKSSFADVSTPLKPSAYLYRRQGSSSYSRKTVQQRPPTRRCAGATTTKYKQEKYRTSSEARSACIALGQEQYLKFSLTVTDALLQTDLFEIERIWEILKEHYDANRALLDEGKLIQTISDICSDLNIAMDSKFLNFLMESQPKSVSYNTQSTDTNAQFSEPFKGRKSPGPSGCCLLSCQPSCHSDTSVDTSQSIQNSCGKQISCDVLHNDFFDSITKPSSNMEEVDVRNEEMPDAGLDNASKMENENVHDAKVEGLDILHEVSSKFVYSSCTEVESDDSVKPHEYVVPVKSRNKLVLANSSNLFEKGAKKLVAAHYYTSVEPEVLGRRELSVQTAEQGETREGGLSDSCDATTQSVSITLLSASTASTIDTKKARKFSAGVQYVVLDYPLLVPAEHKKYDFVDVRKSQNRFNQRNNHGTRMSFLHQPPSRNTCALPNRCVARAGFERRTTPDRGLPEIKESLSCFYPTIATQVSSMDLLNAKTTRRHTLYQQREREFCQISRMTSNRSKSMDCSFPRNYKRLHPYTYSSDAFTNITSVQNRKQDPVLDQNEYRVDYKQRVWNKVVRLGSDTQDSLGRKNRAEMYERNDALISPLNPRRSSTSVQEKTIHLNRDSVRRTKYLQHDIKRLSRDESHLKRNVSDSLRRADFFVILKRNSHCSIAKEHYPSAMPLPKQKRMTILRKESEWEIGEMVANEIH